MKVLFKKIKKKIKRFIRRVVTFIAKYTIPIIYINYCRFVYWTSKVTDGTEEIEKFFKNKGEPISYVSPLWHQDVFLVSYAFRKLSGHTIASKGAAGEVITRMLQKCGYTIFRGGSSKGKKRRSKILEDFIDFVKKERDGKAAIGITVDGSSGPIYRMKTGVIVMAIELGSPMFCARIWCKRKILLKTWDRTMIPLPFNDIRIFISGPYYVPKEAKNDPEVFSQFHKYLQNEMLEITYCGFEQYDKIMNKDLLSNFPEGWKPDKEKNNLL